MNSKQALKQLQQFQSTRKNPNQYFSQYENELGVGDARNQVSDLRNTIRNTESALKGVNESVAGRTRGQMVTEAQRARLEGLERQPLAEELSGYQTQYSDQSQTLRDLLGQATQKAQFGYQGDTDRTNALQAQYDRLFGREQAEAERKRAAQQAAREEARFRAQMALENRKFQESMRQFDRQLATAERQARAAEASIDSANAGGGGGFTDLLKFYQKQQNKQKTAHSKATAKSVGSLQSLWAAASPKKQTKQQKVKNALNSWLGI